MTTSLFPEMAALTFSSTVAISCSCFHPDVRLYKPLRSLWLLPWCWARLKVGGAGDDRGWDGWMASPTQWIWVWAKLWELLIGREAWHAAVHGLQRVGHNWATELTWRYWQSQGIYSCSEWEERQGLLSSHTARDCLSQWPGLQMTLTTFTSKETKASTDLPGPLQISPGSLHKYPHLLMPVSRVPPHRLLSWIPDQLSHHTGTCTWPAWPRVCIPSRLGHYCCLLWSSHLFTMMRCHWEPQQSLEPLQTPGSALQRSHNCQCCGSQWLDPMSYTTIPETWSHTRSFTGNPPLTQCHSNLQHVPTRRGRSFLSKVSP